MKLKKAIPDLKRYPSSELVQLSTMAAEARDYVLATHCAIEAARRRGRFQRAILAPLEAADLPGINWWPEAIEAARSVRKTTQGNHHVYVVLLDGFARDSRYGLYVGESRYTPERRFANHMNGKHAARHVRRLGKCLLPELYAHLNPLSREEAKALEPVLAAAFRNAGIRTEGGH